MIYLEAMPQGIAPTMDDSGCHILRIILLL